MGFADQLSQLDGALLGSERLYRSFWRVDDLENAIMTAQAIIRLLDEDGIDDKITVRTSACSTTTDLLTFGFRHNLFQTKSREIAFYQVKLAEALGNRFLHSGRLVDLEEQIQLCFDAKNNSLEPTVRDRAAYLIAVAQRSRYEIRGQLEDITASVDGLRTLLARNATSANDKALYEAELATSLLLRHIRLGNTDDLHSGTSLFNSLCSSMLKDHPSWDYILARAGMAAVVQYQQDGNVELLKTAHDRYTLSLELRPLGHRDRHASLHGMGAASYLAYKRMSNRAQLDLCIDLCQEALDLRPLGHPERKKSLTNLAVFLKLRYDDFGSPSDLDRAADLHHEAASLYLPTDPNRWTPLHNLATLCQLRCHTSGSLQDLSEAIRLSRASLEAMGTRHSARRRVTTMLAQSLSLRFELRGSDDASREAMAIFRESFALHKASDPEYGMPLFGLLGALLDRFQIYHGVSDLREATELNVGDWLADRENRSDHHYGIFCRLGGNLQMALFEFSGDVTRLDQAIQLYDNALRSSDADKRMRARYMHHLADALRKRYRVNGSIADALEAAEAQRSAQSPLHPSQMDYVEGLFGMAAQHLILDGELFEPSKSIACLLEAFKNEARSARLRVSEGIQVLDQLLDLHSRSLLPNDMQRELLATYQVAVELLAKVAYLGLDLRSLLRVLEEGEHLGTSAAEYALRLQEGEGALEILQASRAVFWSQHLRLRTSFRVLPHSLRIELEDASQSLELLHLSNSESTSVNSHLDSTKISCAWLGKKSCASTLTSL